MVKLVCFLTSLFNGPLGVGQSVTECVVKALCDVKVTKPEGTQNLAMLRVVCQALIFFLYPKYNIKILWIF
jgi:hypothetical protein